MRERKKKHGKPPFPVLCSYIWTAVGHMDVPEIKSETRFIGIPTYKEDWKRKNDFVGINYFILITNVRKINILGMLSIPLISYLPKINYSG